MRHALPLVLLMLAWGGVAAADPAYEARTAVGACLAAVIDKAPVEDAKGQDVAIDRETRPNLCRVTVSGGEPQNVRAAAMQAISARPERFAPARSRWDAGPFASRETFCNAPGRRALNLVLETGRPGADPVLTATVLEADARDPRCDEDRGLQRP